MNFVLYRPLFYLRTSKSGGLNGEREGVGHSLNDFPMQ